MKNAGTFYDAAFYANQVSGSMQSAQEVLQIVNDLLHPKSVVDVGCGIGSWLKVWMDLGLEEVLGIDGDYVKREQLLIPVDRFYSMDLAVSNALNRRFDLVESLEVAEHLPERNAENFIGFLTSLSDVVLFSAAIPYQGGSNHINEQWPEYWERLFFERGYIAMDCLRDAIWQNPKIEIWYRQNIIFYVKKERADLLGKLPAQKLQHPLNRVHPGFWRDLNENPRPLGTLLKMLPFSFAEFSKSKFRRFKGTVKRFVVR